VTSRHVDVAIIGLGSAGEALASEMARRGCRVVGFEAGRVGGECPFTACMPSKSLLHDASIGSSWPDARAHRDEVIEHLHDDEHTRELEALGVEVVRGAATLVDEGIVESGSGRWRADHVVLSTGSSPVIPPIDGLDPDRVLTSDDLMVADELPDSLIILGGGAIGCEAATIMAGFDRAVTMIEVGSLLGGSVDPAVAELLAEQLSGAGIEVLTDTELVAVDHQDDQVLAHLSSGEEVTAAALLVAAGQTPRWSDVGLGNVGIDDDPEVDSEYRVEGSPWLRAIGDLNGRAPWTHGANHEARRLARLLVGDDPGPDTTHMAHCVFTAPPVAAIGVTAQEAEGGRAVVVGTARYSDVARYATDMLDEGIVVVVADADTGELLGASGIGAHFDDVIGIVAALHHAGATVQQAAELVLPFPTMSQVLTPAFQDAVDAMDGAGG